MFEFNPMGGGRIIRDKLWFYVTYRSLSAENTVPGMFFNRNAGDPTKWVVDFDTGRFGLQRQHRLERHRAHHVADLAA